jgi:hypothetical protein
MHIGGMMTALHDDFSRRTQLEFIADQVQQLEQLAKLDSLVKQVEEWERSSSVSRLASASNNLASAFKQEYDLIQRRVDLALAAYKVSESLSRRISQLVRIFYLRCRAALPIRRFGLWLVHSLTGRTPVSPLSLGDRTWHLLVAHPPIAPPHAI